MHVYSDSEEGGVRGQGWAQCGGGEESLNIISDQFAVCYTRVLFFVFFALPSRNRIMQVMQVLCGVRADKASSPIRSLELLELHFDSSWHEPNFQPHWF